MAAVAAGVLSEDDDIEEAVAVAAVAAVFAAEEEGEGAAAQLSKSALTADAEAEVVEFPPHAEAADCPPAILLEDAAALPDGPLLAGLALPAEAAVAAAVKAPPRVAAAE